MDIKETEKMLEQSANDIKMRDFSEVWQDIKDRVEVPQKKVFTKKISAMILAVSFVLLFAIALPIYLFNIPKAPDTIYYQDKLSMVEVTESAFYDDLLKDKVTHVSFGGYTASSYILFKTEDNIAKGGIIDLYDNISSPTEIIKLRFYDEKVELSDEQNSKVYNETYSKDGITAKYNEGESYPQDSVYSYEMFVTYNKVNYIIEYMGTADNPIDFLESFFN